MINKNEKGFTLLESMLAVLIIGIISLLAIPKIINTDRHAVDAMANQITSDMRTARQMAMGKAGNYIVRFYAVGGLYTSYDIRSASNVVAKTMNISGQTVCVAIEGFGPNLTFDQLGKGTPTGRIIRISTPSGNYKREIEITLATGRVSVKP